MTRSVTGRLPESADVIIQKLAQAAVRYDVEFRGDIVSGYARGKGFHVDYVIQGEHCTLTVTKKPLLVPWSMVEKALGKIF